MPTVNFNINGRPQQAEPGTLIIEACQRAGIAIPRYCFHPGLTVVGSCRMCLVELQGPSGPGKLVPSCQTHVAEGVNVLTDSDRVVANRRAVMEYLLINHPLDCPVCDQAGECYLQDYSFNHGRPLARFAEAKIKQPKKDVGRHIVLYMDRCVLCSRCVRFTREVAGTGELTVVGRGNRCEIDIFPGRPLDNKLSGCVADICPVGALLDKKFLHRQRVWRLSATPSVCARCSAGCNINIFHNLGQIWRLKPRENRQVNGFWMCDDGRYGWDHVNEARRLDFRPRVREEGAGAKGRQGDATETPSPYKGEGRGEGDRNAQRAGNHPHPTLSLAGRGIEETASAGRRLAVSRETQGLAPGDAWRELSTEDFAEAVATRLSETVHAHGLGCVAAVLSPMWTTEEQFMLACVVRAIDPQATLALGPVPIVGADETFKGGFVIRAEKCPNRRGAERVLAAVGGPQATFDQLMTRLGQPIRAVWLNGDYPEVPNAECQVPNDSADWLTVDQAKHLSADGLLVIASDLFPTAATAAAQMQWAGCSWAERGGTFVNVDGMVQQLSAAPVGPEFAVPAGDLLWRMLGQAGPVDLVELWRQMAEAGVGGYPPAPPGDVQCSPAPFAGNRSAPGVHQ